MSQRGFMAMGLRLLGVYALLVACMYLQYTVSMLNQLLADPRAGLLGLLASLSPAVVGIVLLVCADRLAAWLGYGAEPMGIVTKTSLGSREFQAIGFSLIGVLVLIRAVGQLTGLLVNIVMIFSPPGSMSGQLGYLTTTSLGSSIAVVFQLGVGIGLFFGGCRLADWWHERYAPPEELEEDAGDTSGTL